MDYPGERGAAGRSNCDASARSYLTSTENLSSCRPRLEHQRAPFSVIAQKSKTEIPLARTAGPGARHSSKRGTRHHARAPPSPRDVTSAR